MNTSVDQNSPTVVVNDNAMVKSRESVEAFNTQTVSAIDRALRLNTSGLASRVREVVKD